MWRTCWSDSKGARARSPSVSFNSGPGALAVKAVLGGTLGNGQAGGLSSLSVHISLSEPRIQCTQKENEAPDASPSPNPPPRPGARPRPLHLPRAVIMGTCSRRRPDIQAGIKQASWPTRGRAVNPRNQEPRCREGFLSQCPREPPAPCQHPPTTATPYPMCQDCWGLLPSSPAPPSLLSDGDRLRGPGA